METCIASCPVQCDAAVLIRPEKGIRIAGGDAPLRDDDIGRVSGRRLSIGAHVAQRHESSGRIGTPEGERR